MQSKICLFGLGVALLLISFVGADAGDESDMVLIPSGSFIMGHGTMPRSGPQRTVDLDAFYVDRCEVKVGDFKKCLKAGACRWSFYDPPSLFFGDDQPMVLVTWVEAQSYCRWLGKRLPTEAEWEKAFRGEDGRAYPWGNEYKSGRANLIDAKPSPQEPRRYRFTRPVCSTSSDVSPYGVRDLCGNVQEWTSDVYLHDYHLSTPKRNPHVKSDNPNQDRLAHTVRGGYFAAKTSDGAAYYREGERLGEIISMRLGFRCAKDVTP